MDRQAVLMLYTANKKAKKLRDEAKVILDYLNGKTVVPALYHQKLKQCFTVESINNYINTVSERYKAEYLPFVNYEVGEDVIDFLLHATSKEAGKYVRNKGIICDIYYHFYNQLQKIECRKSEEMNEFYQMKTEIIINPKNGFRAIGWHTLWTKSVHYHDGVEHYVQDAILFEQEGFRFHVKRHHTKEVNYQQDYPYLGELGVITSELTNLDYQDWSLSQLMKFLEKYK